MADDVPLRFMLAMGGSNDLALNRPGVRIVAYAEPVFVFTDSFELPLEGMVSVASCCTENGHTS